MTDEPKGQGAGRPAPLEQCIFCCKRDVAFHEPAIDGLPPCYRGVIGCEMFVPDSPDANAFCDTCEGDEKNG